MPRRKLTTINLKGLKSYFALMEELRSNPAYADKDLSTLKLTVLNSYDASIRDVDKAIQRLQWYVAANRNMIETIKDEQLINRTKLAKMLGISRQTLTSWINKGFITPSKSKYLTGFETFSTDLVLEELRKYKTEHPEERI